MDDIFVQLNDFNFLSLIVRLSLAVFCGGIIGVGREQKGRPAGFRTFMITSLGAALTILLAQYEYEMLSTDWFGSVPDSSIRFDASRYSAQVINGIGFLGAGTIITTAHQKVTGLTTASGLWASACMGIAAGAGFYECIFVSVILILIAMEILPFFESLVHSYSRTFSIAAEFRRLEDISEITASIRQNHGSVNNIVVETDGNSSRYHSSAIFDIQLDKKHHSHKYIIVELAKLNCIYSVNELE